MKNPQISICGPFVPRPGSIGFKKFAKSEHAESGQCGNEDIKSIQESQFGKFREILNAFQPRGKVGLGRKPSDM